MFNNIFENFNFDKSIISPIIGDPFQPEIKTHEEIIEEELEYSKEPDFEKMNCKHCNSKVNNNFLWYYLKHLENEDKSIVLCSFDCLKEYSEFNNYKMYEYEIVEYTRCSAYFKCKEIGNLRYKCENKKSLTVKERFQPIITNFCEPGQAGIILATYRIHQILNEFAKEGEKQFKITMWMTILVIVLTIINLVPSIYSMFNNQEIDELRKIKHLIEDINNDIKLEKQNNLEIEENNYDKLDENIIATKTRKSIINE